MENIEYNETLRETLHTNQLSSGIKCYIIPKKGYVEKQAAIAINYGSADNRFQVDGSVSETPYGIAHFMEHKLFESQEMNIFDRFTQQGANVNAFTNFTSTAYYFNCIENFDQNLRLLLNFTQNPYFTDENVEKEKGIIEQEINMYMDNPNWQLFTNLLKAMYHQSPIRVDIAGTAESIAGITKNLLYECYERFYFPGNSAVICVGDFEPRHIYEIADRLIKSKPAQGITRMYGNEPAHVRDSYVESRMSVSMPMFDLGFKEERFDGDSVGRMAATKMLVDIIAGQSSSVYERMYNEGLIDGSFSVEYVAGTFFGCSIFSGGSQDPERVASYIMDEVERLKNEGIGDEKFQTIKNKHIGRFIRGFNSIDQIVSGQVDMFAKGTNLFHLMRSCEEISKEYLEQRLHEHFRGDNHSLSVVLQK